MNCTENGTTRYDAGWGPDPEENSEEAPLLRINVFGGFEVLVDGRHIDYGCLRQRRLKTLLGILAVNHGQELYSDYLASSIWPDSPSNKQRNSFYNLWYLLTHAIVPDGVDRNRYFSREQFSCRLLEDHVSTDVADAELACADLQVPGVDPVSAVDAYRRLQRAYRGDLLPGENGNAIITRAREEWRERVVESLFAAAKAMYEQGDLRTSLWMVKAACRIDPSREDLVRLRMRLLLDLGRPSAAMSVYNEMHDYLVDQVGVGPSRQSAQLAREVMAAGPVELRLPLSDASRRRRACAPAKRADTSIKPGVQRIDIPL